MRPGGSRLTVAAAMAAATYLLAAGVEAQPVTVSTAYVPVAPCRIVDTRVPAAPLVAGVQRLFHVVGTGNNFPAQGGAASGCGIPGYLGTDPSVKAVMFNFIAVNPSGAGNLRAWAGDQPVPLASVLNYAVAAGVGGGPAGLNIANGLSVPVALDTVEGDDVAVRADVSNTHLIVDVVGYFFDSPLAWHANRTGSLQATGFTTIPGLSLSIRLPAPSRVHIVASGSQRYAGSGAFCHEAYRLVIDGTGLGDPGHGQRIQMNTSASWWAQWVLSHTVILPAGTHTIEVQNRESAAVTAECVVCGEIGGGIPDYTDCTVNATTAIPF